MKNVVFFVNDLNAGGIENYLLRFLHHYDGKIVPTVVCKSAVFGDLEEKYRKIKHITLVPLKMGYFDVLGCRNTYLFLKNGNFDTAVDFTGNFAAFPLLMAKLAKIKTRIVFYRGATNHFEETFFKKKYNSFLNFVVLNAATSILSNSKAALRFFFKKQNDKRFEVIYNGLDASSFLNSTKNLREELNIPNDAFVISHVGRFTEAKNHKTIIETAIALCKQNKEIYFILCGKNVDVNLKERVERENLCEKIKLLGYRSDVILILNSSDAFYFPSLTEGQPNALIEAMIVGLPFVASNIEPVKESVPEDFHQFLVNPNDVSSAMEMLQLLFKDEVARKNMNLSQWAKEHYEPNYLFSKFYIKL